MFNIHKILNQPLPIEAFLNYRWRFIIGASLFVTLFLFYFEPFGLQQIQVEKRAWLIIGFGLICFAVIGLNLILSPLLFPKHFETGNWTVFKHATVASWTLIMLASSLFAYNYALGISELNMSGYMSMLVSVLSIAVFPAFIGGVLIINIQLKGNLKSSAEIMTVLANKQLELRELPSARKKILLTDEKGKEVIQALEENILMIKAADNYVEVFWRDEGKIRHSLLRRTIKDIETDLNLHSTFFRCHRAYIINLYHLKNVSGNSQRIEATLDGITGNIPIARNKVHAFHKLMKAIS